MVDRHYTDSAKFKSIIPSPIDIIIYTDASKAGWSANMGTHRINGRWDETEAELHINILELMAVEIAILAFCKNEHKKHKIHDRQHDSSHLLTEYGWHQISRM